METKAEFKVNKHIFLVIILFFGLVLAFSLIQYFTAFLGSVIFYVLFKGWMDKLVNHKKWKKNRAAILIMVVSFFIILLPISLFFSMVLNKVAPVVSNPTVFVPYIQKLDTTIQNKFHVKILTADNIEKVKTVGAKIASGAVNQGLAIFTSIGMMYFFLFFMLTNFNRMEAAIVLYLPFQKSKIKMFGSELVAQTFSNAIGIPLIAVVQGLFAFAIYLIAGLPEAGFWALLTGFASIIPIIGTGIIWVPVCVYLFAMGDIWQGFAVLAWSTLIMGSMDNIIRFILAKKMADVHPVITILGIIIGLDYLGITGLIFGPLIISYFVILLKIYYTDYQHVIKKSKVEDHVLEIGLPLIYSKKFTKKRE